MKRKLVTITLITVLALATTACEKKDIDSATSTVSSVVEKINENTTSLAEKVDNTNPELAKEDEVKTDLSDLPEVEVPEVPKNDETVNIVPLTETEVNTIVEAYTNKIRGTEGYEYLDEWNKEDVLCDYVIKELASNPELENVTLGEYFGDNYSQVARAENKDETIKHYKEAEEAYAIYILETLLHDFMSEQTGVENKNDWPEGLNAKDFHKNDSYIEKAKDGTQN